MNKTEPKYRRPLNTEQIQILEILYKFRFVSAMILKAYFIESNPGMNVFKRLEILEQQGFIAKRYFDNYRLLHKPVAYYLRPTGARRLAEYRDDTSEISPKNIYRDSEVREQFITHCLTVFDIYNRLMAGYGDDLDFLSKSDQSNFDSFPTPLPDAYLTLQADSSIKHFFLDVLDDDAHLLVDASKKISRYFKYRGSGSWTAISSDFPSIIFVCNSESACRKVQKRCDTAINKAWVRDVNFKVVTLDKIDLSTYL